MMLSREKIAHMYGNDQAYPSTDEEEVVASILEDRGNNWVRYRWGSTTATDLLAEQFDRAWENTVANATGSGRAASYPDGLFEKMAKEFAKDIKDTASRFPSATTAEAIKANMRYGRFIK